MGKLDMRLLSPLVMISRVITTTLKYPAAVGEARMLPSAQKDASLGAKPPRPGSEFALATLS